MQVTVYLARDVGIAHQALVHTPSYCIALVEYETYPTVQYA